MAKNLNSEYRVSMKFEADTDRARKQLADLQRQLNSLVANTGGKLGIGEELNKAAHSAAELSAHLQSAYDQRTGNLDFSKFNESIKKSGKAISDLSTDLLKLGPDGRQAFLSLATAITNSEVPIKRISNLLREMGVTLKNTIKWQISSSAIHAFMGAIQGAYGYAQNLNESLNNIRIVTGQNIDQMEKFAITANKAAKALSASTLDYTNAALIYYQQGLSDQEVKARTDVTVKMANVTGDTAEKVSQQLTAVWNNFAKGSDNLEYFADVMTALGAATASSTDEISEGLEKFSAVAQTVGLSYEYATAALATVTATTRESASVVGNAFKTLFARLEGLKLGETLDDGTDLNKYSQALATIGVNIKDASGQLRNMDDILDDMAKRWNTLDKASQMATAQTVGGVRQYNTLIALMENWDFMQENLETARNASGELQKQADIFAESWEAAQKRVKAATQTIFQSLINDKFFITLLNWTEKALVGVNNLIKAIGGLPGLLATIATVFTNLFEKQLAQGISNLAYNLNNLTAAGQRRNQEAKKAILDEMQSQIVYAVSDGSPRGDIIASGITKQIELKQQLIEKSEQLNDIEKTTANLLLDQINARQQAYEKAAAQTEQLELQYDEIKDSILQKYILQQRTDNNRQVTSTSKIQQYAQDFNQYISKVENWAVKVKDVQEAYKAVMTGQADTAKAVELLNRLNDKYNLGLSETQRRASLASTQIVGLYKGLERESQSHMNNLIQRGATEEEAKLLVEIFTKLTMAKEKERDSQEALNISVEQYEKILATTTIRLQSWEQNIVQTAQLISGVSMAINQIKGIIQTLNNEDLSFGEKLLAIMTSVGMLIPNVLRMLTVSKGLYAQLTGALSKYVITQQLHILTLKEEEAITILNTLANKGLNASEITRELVTRGLIASEKELIVAEELDNLAKQNGNKITAKLILQAIANVAKTKIETGAVKENTRVWIANHAARLGIIGVAALLVAGIIALIVALSKEDQTIQKLNETYQKNKELAEQMNESWKSIFDTFKDYNSTLKTIQNLTVGTLEWAEAVEKLNEDAEKLIEKYNLIYGKDFYYGESGELLFTSAGQSIMAEGQQKVDTTNRSIAISQAWNREERNARLYEATREKTLTNPDNYGLGPDAYASLRREFINNVVDNFDQNSSLYRILDKESELSESERAKAIEQLTANEFNYISNYLRRNGQRENFTQQQLKDFLLSSSSFSVGGFDDSYVYNTAAFKQLIANDLQLYGTGNLNERIVNIGYDKQTQDEIDAQISERLLDITDKETYLRDKYYSSYDDKQWEEWKQNNNIDKTLNQLIGQDIRRGNVQDLNKAVNDALIGVSNQDFWKNVLSGNIANLSPEDQQLLSASLSKIPPQVKKAFEEMNLNAEDEINQLLNNYDNGLSYYKSQIQDIQSIQESIKELNKTFGSLKFGDTVESIEGLSEEAASYFTVMADGTYKLTGSAKDFQKALLEQERQGFRDNIANAKSILGTLSKPEDIWDPGTWSRTQLEKYGGQFATRADYLQQKERYQAYQEASESYGTEKAYAEQTLATNRYGLAMTANDIEDLNQLLHSGEIKIDHYAAAWGILEQERDLKGLDTEQLSDYIGYLEEAEHMSEEVADTVARSAMKMAKGTDALSKNFETWSKVLTTSEKRSQEYYESLTGLREAVADLLDISEDHLSESFLRNADNMKLMQQAAEGDKEAVELLREALSEDLYIQFIDSNDDITSKFTDIRTQYETFKDYIQNNPVGATLDNSQFIESLNQMLANMQITAEEANALLDSMGVEAKFATQEVTLPTTVTDYKTITHTKELDPDDYGARTESWTETIEAGTHQIDNTMYIGASNVGLQGTVTAPKITGVVKKANSSYAPSVSSKSNKGGGSKSGSQKKNSDVERYHEVKSTLKDLESEYGRIGKARERAFGPGQLKLYDQELEKLDEIIAANRRYLAEARGWMDVDIENANKVASLFGFEAFDDQTNWTEIQYKLNDFYNDALASGDEEAQKLYDTYSDYIQKAIDTHGVILEREEAWIDRMNERQDKLYEKWSKEIDLKVNLDERNLKLIDLKLKQLGDSFYKRVEAAWLLLQKIGLASNENIDISKALEDQDFLQGKFDEVAGLNLSPDQQYQAYSLIMDKAIDAANALLDLREQMMSYYADSISQMREEWNNADTQFAHLTTTLDHYDKLLDLTGQGKDYDKRLAILQGQLKVSRDQLDVHKEELSVLEEEERRRAQDLQDALSTNNEYAINFAKKNLEVAKENVRELTEAVQQDIEKIAETAQTVLTTSLEQIYKEYEKRLTNGVGYDYLNQIMDLQADKADLVLTQTNQIYETNKMLRDLDRDIEKTENTAAKARLNSFRQEIKALQEKGELTHFELEDAQLRYEVLKAQIALEEAQNAKSTVRLQRDSEGNFGYVYTADREKVAEAEDNFEKANNDRYNHALEAQEKFLRQYYEVQKRYQDDLTALDEQRIAGAISEEEYWTRRQEITNLYAPLLETLEKNHLDAIGVMNETAAAHTNDSWTQALIGQGYGLQGKTEQWRNESVKLVGEVEGSFNQWKTTIDEVVEPAVTGDLNDMRDAVDEVTTKSKALKDYIISDVLSAQQQELDKLDALITKYLSIQDRIDELIIKYQKLATDACEAIGKIGEQILQLPNEKIIPVITQDRSTPTGDNNSNGDNLNGELLIDPGEEKIFKDQITYNIYGITGSGEQMLQSGLTPVAEKNYEDYIMKAKRFYQGQGYKHIYGVRLENGIPTDKVVFFNTGGYTGEWGPAGKLAVLHQKELVLNADDTKNFLAGMSILRNITSMIDLQAAAMGAMDAYSNLAVPGANRSLDQNVTIHAEFPNVTQHNEIELAFADLINRASQYANRY